MDDKLKEINGTAQELDITGKFILKRLAQVLDQPEKLDINCQCESASLLQESQNEVDKLKERVAELERLEKEKEDTLIAAIDELKRVEAEFDQLQLTIQTDDVKLRHLGDPNTHRFESKDVKVTQRKRKETKKATSGTSMAKPGNVEQKDEIKTENNDKEAERVGSEEDTVINRPHNGDVNEHTLGATGGVNMKMSPSRDQSDDNGEKSDKHDDSTSATGKLKASQDNEDTKKGPEVVHQPVRMTLHGEIEWYIQARQEFLTAWQLRRQNNEKTRGIHTMIVIDISASMIPYWDQIKLFYHDFINGLEETANKCGESLENVAVVTFGHEVHVQEYYTNNFTTLRERFDNLKLGGPSPLSAGITFAMEGIGRPHCGSVSVKDIHQGVKLILLTDGEATEPLVYAGPDECLDQEMAKASVIDAFSKLEPVSGEVELYTVPVGKANTEILELGTSIAEGKILDYKSGRQFSRRLYLMLKRNPYSSVCLTHDELLTAEDLKDMGEILKENEAIQKKLENRLNLEVEGSNLPKLGSRVRRGPDWEYGNQDDSGPGTVISHTPNGEKCFVNWDNNNHTGVYKYGAEGKYDILLTDDVRQLQPGETIAIGCTVKIGSGWNSDNTEIDQTNVGTVINLRLKETPKAMVKATVKWDNGLRGEYRYDETPEIVVCDPATGETSDISTGASSKSSGTSDSPGGASNMSRYQHISRPSVAKPMKNKNKNKQ